MHIYTHFVIVIDVINKNIFNGCKKALKVEGSAKQRSSQLVGPLTNA